MHFFAEKFGGMKKKYYLCTAKLRKGHLLCLYIINKSHNSHLVSLKKGLPFLDLAIIGKYGGCFCANAKSSFIMQNANLEGMIQRPEQEIALKLDAYFCGYGMKVRGTYDRDNFDGDYAYEIRGSIDDIHVAVAYYDHKPQKKVLRELMALDDRISDIDCTRLLSNKSYREKSCDMCMDAIYVMIDGMLMQTTWYEYVNYQARNIDFTKREML